MKTISNKFSELKEKTKEQVADLHNMISNRNNCFLSKPPKSKIVYLFEKLHNLSQLVQLNTRTTEEVVSSLGLDIEQLRLENTTLKKEITNLELKIIELESKAQFNHQKIDIIIDQYIK